jgi:hypothetical protein
MAAGQAAPRSDAWRVEPPRPATVGDLLTRIEQDAAFAASTAGFPEPHRVSDGAPWAATSRDVWIEGDGYRDRMRLRTEGALRRADGAPAPLGPLDPAELSATEYDVSYVRGWPQSLGRTDSGMEVTLTPHAGVELTSHGGAAVAGATLEIGGEMERLAPSGEARFGDRPRWYLYAAGSGRAVGYNWARNRDGDFARSGMSHDSGAFLGDASIGVAMRRGAMQSSIGVVYREIDVDGLRGGNGIDTDVSEGLVAFQFSIKPQ